jgi:hypothetical protein
LATVRDSSSPTTSSGLPGALIVTALNTFDFYFDQRHGDPQIRHHQRRHSCRPHPRTIYRATLGFVDAVQPAGSNATASEKADMIAAEWRAKGLNTRISYRCSD